MSFNASVAALHLLGDTLYSNMLLVGFALQRGWLPVGEKALRDAVRMNGQSVDSNLLALDLGRLAAADYAAFKALFPGDSAETVQPTLSDFLKKRHEFLRDYQNEAYAEQFSRALRDAIRVEANACPGSERFSWAAARSLSQLMSYKDEYEVARLYTTGSFKRTLDSSFGENYSFDYQLSPPILSGVDKRTNRPRKVRFGEWLTPALRLLTRFRWLRGTRFDVFGYTEERRTERELVRNLFETIRALLEQLRPETIDKSVAILERFQTIRGFGSVKQSKAKAVLPQIEAMRAELMAPERSKSQADQ